MKLIYSASRTIHTKYYKRKQLYNLMIIIKKTTSEILYNMMDIFI